MEVVNIEKEAREKKVSAIIIEYERLTMKTLLRFK